jgi:hypothetical protein
VPDLLPAVRFENDRIVGYLKKKELGIAGTGIPVLALGSQRLRYQGFSLVTGKARPGKYEVDSGFRAPLCYNLGSTKQLTTILRTISVIIETARELTELDEDGISLRAQLLDQDEDEAEIVLCDRRMSSNNPDLNFEWEPHLPTSEEFKDWKLDCVSEDLTLKVSNRKIYFEIERYAEVTSRHDPDESLVVPCSLKGTKGSRWIVWADDITTDWIRSLQSFLVGSLRYLIRDGDDSKRAFNWWNRTKFVCPWTKRGGERPEHSDVWIDLIVPILRTWKVDHHTACKNSSTKIPRLRRSKPSHGLLFTAGDPDLWVKVNSNRRAPPKGKRKPPQRSFIVEALGGYDSQDGLTGLVTFDWVSTTNNALTSNYNWVRESYLPFSTTLFKLSSISERGPPN